MLHPQTPHDPRADGASPALVTAGDVLKRRSGGRLRLNRNTLVFCAADAAALLDAQKTARTMLAWRSIAQDPALDLKQSQRMDAEEQVRRSAGALETAVRRAWTHVLYPEPSETPGEAFDLHRSPVKNTSGKPVVQAVWEQALRDDLVRERLGQATLAERISKNWPPENPHHLPSATVRDWFTQYVAFERVRDETVLADALAALLSDQHAAWGYSEDVDGEGRYRAVQLGRLVTPRFDSGALLVRREILDGQQTPDPHLAATNGGSPQNDVREPTRVEPGHERPTPSGVPPRARPTRFYGSVQLNSERPVRDMQSIIDSVIGELLRTPGAQVRLTLEIEATAGGGFSPEDAAIVRDNTRTLNFKPDSTGFADEQ